MIKFTDTHAHLCDAEFTAKLPRLVADLPDQGVGSVFCVGYNLESSQTCVNLSKQYPSLFAIVGIHPSEIETCTASDYEKLEQLADDPKVLAIGEIGLDYHYPPFDRLKQQQGFMKQLQLAHDHALPVCIHVRDAESDLLALLQQNRHLLQHGGVIHCFAQDLAFFEQVKALGFLVSVGGTVTFSNAKALQQTVSQIPLSHLMLETDCPYLTPEPLRGKERNQPKNVTLVAKKLAELLHTDEQTIATVTTQNIQRLFPKWNLPL